MTNLLQNIYDAMMHQPCQSFNMVGGNIFIARGQSYPNLEKYIIMETVSAVPTSKSKSGPSDMDTIRVQFTLFGKTSEFVNNLCNQLRKDLDYTGNSGDVMTYVDRCIWDTCMYDLDQEAPYELDAQDIGMYAKQIDFIFRVDPKNYIES